jgi:hypothetical protein
LASLGLASPVTSILLSHGSTVAAAIAMAVRPGRRRAGTPATAMERRNNNVR